MGNNDTDGHPHNTAAHHDRDHETEQDMRNPHAEIHEPEYKLIDLAAECRRERSEEQRNAGADKCGSKADLQTDGHSLDRAQKHIAPHVIRTERMRQRRRKILLPIVNSIGTFRHCRSKKEQSKDENNRGHGEDQPPLTNTQTAQRERKCLVHNIPLPSRSCGSTTP